VIAFRTSHNEDNDSEYNAETKEREGVYLQVKPWLNKI
jgi:hypothetical protein